MHVKVGNNSRATPVPIKWISLAERPDRLNQGLCFNCYNKWVRGHKCPGKLLLLMVDEDEVTRQPGDQEQDDVMESDDISILNSLVDHARGSGTHAFIDHGKGPDIVMGIQWSQKLAKVTYEYSMQTMEFTWFDQGEVLEGFQHKQGLLLFRGRYFIGAQSKLKEVLLFEFHDTPSAGHGGSKKKIGGEIQRRIWDPEIKIFLDDTLKARWL
nr:Ty3/gypsy retrotransposon protein [Tanacetum cinerariifolium]